MELKKEKESCLCSNQQKLKWQWNRTAYYLHPMTNRLNWMLRLCLWSKYSFKGKKKRWFNIGKRRGKDMGSDKILKILSEWKPNKAHNARDFWQVSYCFKAIKSRKRYELLDESWRSKGYLRQTPNPHSCTHYRRSLARFRHSHREQAPPQPYRNISISRSNS